MSSKRGDAVADSWREKFEKNRQETDLSLTRLEVRAEMKSSGEEELSDIIDQRTLAIQAVKKESSPPASGPSANAVSIIKSVKGWPQAIVGLAALALAAWYMWLHK